MRSFFFFSKKETPAAGGAAKEAQNKGPWHSLNTLRDNGGA